jgi:dihydrofolate reductase
MTTYSIIVAADENNGIGKNNQLPWHISEDLKNFKRLTTGKTILMGRKTWESLPIKPLPNRQNIVISSNPDYIATGAIVCKSIHQALEVCSQFQEVFIIGGAEIYRQFFPITHKLYLTRVFGIFDTDTALAGFDDKEWKLISDDTHKNSGNNSHNFSFLVFERKI